MEGQRVSAEQAKRDLNRELLGVAQPQAEADAIIPPLFRQMVAEMGLPVDVIEGVERPSTLFQPPPASPGTGYERVGIVFVHGVGSQRAGDTVREYATPLVDWLEEWHRERPGLMEPFRVSWSELTARQRDEPAATSVVIPEWIDREHPDEEGRPSNHPRQEWVITEGWWAARLEAPPLVTMVRWAGKRYRLLIRTLISSAWDSRRRPPHRGFFGALFKFVNGVFFGILYAFAYLAILGVLLLLALIARVPIKAIEEFFVTRLARGVLVDNVGDFYVCIYDRIQAINVRQSIYHTINWLFRSADCTRVIVAAHSGGTVVAVDALGTPDLARLPDGPGSLRSMLGNVTTLITFGAALNQAWDEADDDDERRSPRRIPTDLPLTRNWLNFWTPFDWGHAGQPLKHGRAAGGKDHVPIPVTNGLNPANDHGLYWTNFEEFISRLAQEADIPSDPEHPDRYRGSRFWPGGDPTSDLAHKERVERRYDRVHMLTMWRTAAIAATFAVFLGRYVFGRWDVVADGAFSWALIAKLPVLGLVVSGAGIALDRAVAALGSSPGLQNALSGTHTALIATPVLLAVGLVMAAGYALWVAEFFDVWNERVSRSSAREEPVAQTGYMRWLTVGFVGFLVLLVIPFLSVPQFTDIPARIALLLGG